MTTKGPRGGFNPKTASKSQMKPTPAPKTPGTSVQAEKQIKRPPTPFANKFGTVNTPISERKESYDSDYTGPNKALIGTKLGAKALPSGAAVGQKRPINQSGQVNGRFGTKFPKRHRPNTGHFPQKRSAKGFYGE
jgi:hypothetical protein